METIPKSNCVKIGFTQKPHGIHGELVLRFQEEYYETLEEMPVLLLEIDELLVPYFISEEGLRFKSGESVIVKFDWVNTDKQAKDLCGLSVFVKEEDVVLNEDELLPDDLVGYMLYDQSLGLIGEISDVTDYSGNILLTVIYKDKECLVPFNEDLLIRFDEENREIEMDLPDGLFSLDEE